jgi:amino acid adenylation domain-containing protein
MNAHATPLPHRVVPFALSEVSGTIVERFRKVVEFLGDSLALKSGIRTFTFRELEHRTNVIARVLGESMHGHEHPVALMFRHGNNSIIAQLGVMKLGRSYSCLDADAQQERRDAIFSQLGSTWLLCDSATVTAAMDLRAAFPQTTVLNIDEIVPAAVNDSVAPLTTDADDIACIVNTSGSTGTPKGVMLSHRNILFTAYAHGQDFRISAHDRSLHLCPPSTASACSEIFTALLNGSAVFPFSIKDHGVRRFQELIAEEQLTTFTASPILFRLIARTFRKDERLPSVRLIRLGGDRVTGQDLRILRERFDRDCHLRVGYGASEYMPAMQLFLRGDSDVGVVPLGYPVQGCTISLVDENGAPVPQGEHGEIVIMSPYLSSGYWLDPERTAKAFRINPLNAADRAYHTSDVAYQDVAGRFHFVGRKDSIVKINGKQVCIADVQKALLTISWITDAAVVPVRSSQSGSELVAFVVSNDALPTVPRLRASLAPHLPLEAMPTKVIALDNIPLTHNNKADLQQLKRLAAKMIPVG